MTADSSDLLNLKRDIALIALLFAPVYLNDFGFIVGKTEGQILVVDYISKSLVVIFVFLVQS